MNKRNMIQRPCKLGCGRTTNARSGECHACHHAYRMDINQPSESDALGAGKWVLDGLVQRWVSDEPPEPEGSWAMLCLECNEREARQFYCEPCAVERDKRVKREHMRRVRAEKKRAA